MNLPHCPSSSQAQAANESLFAALRKKRVPDPTARVRPGPPTPDSRDTYEVVINGGQVAGVLAVFDRLSRKNAQDFANGFNCGARWRWRNGKR